MGYLHINNLYKAQEVLLFKEVYALEKVDGTSTHIKYKVTRQPQLSFFSGCIKHENFTNLFNQEEILANLPKVDDIIIYGEGYGGKVQGQSKKYGSNLKFIAFDVKIGDCWLDVPTAEKIVKRCGLTFVPYIKCSTDLDILTEERDKPSVVAEWAGNHNQTREGIVIRPLIELRKNNNERVIAKYKNDDFRETKKKRQIKDPKKLEVLKQAQDIATEWVTINRLKHVLDKIHSKNQQPPSIENMREILISMCEDIKREARGEIAWSKPVEKEINRQTAIIFKKYFQKLTQQLTQK